MKKTIIAMIKIEQRSQEVKSRPWQVAMFSAYGLITQVEQPRQLRSPYQPQHILSEFSVQSLGLSGVRQLHGWKRVEQVQLRDRHATVKIMELGKLSSITITTILSGSERCIMNWQQPAMFFIKLWTFIIINSLYSSPALQNAQFRVYIGQLSAKYLIEIVIKQLVCMLSLVITISSLIGLHQIGLQIARGEVIPVDRGLVSRVAGILIVKTWIYDIDRILWWRQIVLLACLLLQLAVVTSYFNHQQQHHYQQRTPHHKADKQHITCRWIFRRAQSLVCGGRRG